MSSTGRSKAATAGFTLIELLVVMAILALGLALVPPILARGTEAQSLKIDMRQVIGGLRFARSRAITLNSPVAFLIDLPTRRFSVESSDETGYLHPTTNVTLSIGKREWLGDRSGAIHFYPDGGSSGGELLMSSKANRYNVRIDWLTGDVSAVEE
jgi:general secretion pathway protein H